MRVASAAPLTRSPLATTDVPPSTFGRAHPRPMPPTTDPAALEAARDRARTERLLERIADADLAEHRARQAVGLLGTVTGSIARGAW